MKIKSKHSAFLNILATFTIQVVSFFNTTYAFRLKSSRRILKYFRLIKIVQSTREAREERSLTSMLANFNCKFWTGVIPVRKVLIFRTCKFSNGFFERPWPVEVRAFSSLANRSGYLNSDSERETGVKTIKDITNMFNYKWRIRAAKSSALRS